MLLLGPAGGGTGDDPQTHLTALHPLVLLFVDVCYSEDLPEVDLVSLIEEQIPRYVLRADTLTDFAGYENEDWIRTPVLPPEQDLPLSPELIDETLKYFGEYTALFRNSRRFSRAYTFLKLGRLGCACMN